MPVHIRRKLWPHERSEIFVTSHVDSFFLFFPFFWQKMEKISKESDLWKEKRGSPTISESKLYLKLAHPVPGPILTYISFLACALAVWCSVTLRMRSNDGRENFESSDAPIVTILTFLTNVTCCSSGIVKVVLLLNPENKAFWILLERSLRTWYDFNHVTV